MMINLWGTVQNGQANFNLPPMHFIGKHTVAVTELYIKYKNKIKKGYGTLHTTLIDKCPTNLEQQILFFYHDSHSDYTHVTPTHLSEYIIQCPDLQSSIFTLRQPDKEEIEKIYLQLKVSNARIQ